jgi:hypothetical protein
LASGVQILCKMDREIAGFSSFGLDAAVMLREN